MHFHFIMMNQHARSESPTALSKPPGDEQDDFTTRRSHHSAEKADAKTNTSTSTSTTSTFTASPTLLTKTKSSKRWSIDSILPSSAAARQRRRSRESSSLQSSATAAKKEESFDLMATLKLFRETDIKDWIRLALYLFKRHFYWPLLQSIRSQRTLHLRDVVTEKEAHFLKSHLALLAYSVIAGLAVACPGSFYILFRVALCVLFGQMAIIALHWILYIYDDPAMHRAVVFFKGWLQLVLHHGQRAIQNPDAATVLMAAAAIKSAPVGVNYLCYALRYRMHYVNSLWMDDLSTRHRCFGEGAHLLNKLQDKILNNSMMQPPINYVRGSMSHQESNSIKKNLHPGRLEI